DVVFMPYLQSERFPHQPEGIRFDESDKLVQELDRVLSNNQLPEDYQQRMKQEKIEEEARLIYVGLTRAKRLLFLSCHRSFFTRYNKMKATEPALAFTLLAPAIMALQKTDSDREEVTLG